MSLMLVPALLLGLGCASKQETADLEARLKALEEKVAAQEAKGPGAKGPLAAKDRPAPAPDDPNEKAAGDLMKEAQQAMAGADFAGAKAKIQELQQKYPETRAAKAAARVMTELAIIGTDAPPLDTEKWFQGKAAYGSQPTLLVFWEQWCPHCREEMPQMQALSEKMKGKLNIVGMTKVTKKATDELVMQFIAENKITFPIGKEKGGSLSQAFAVTGIPAAAIVKDGKIIWRGHPNKLTDEFLAKLLG